jgi:hypothetical protein
VTASLLAALVLVLLSFILPMYADLAAGAGSFLLFFFVAMLAYSVMEYDKPGQ